MSDQDVGLPRKVRDRVRRALDGETLSSRTLSQLTAAFDFTDEDRDHAFALLRGQGPMAVSGTKVLPVLPVERGRHRSRTVSEHHYVGPDRSPVMHRTVAVIEAKVDGLRTYPFLFDASTVSVEVVHGGRVTHQVEGLPAGIYGVVIELDRALATGETASLEYVSRFHYPAPPEPAFRRAASGRSENIDIRVEFHPDQLPRRIWWCVWESVDGPVAVEEETELESQHYVKKFTPFIDDACIGFRWEF